MGRVSRFSCRNDADGAATCASTTGMPGNWRCDGCASDQCRSRPGNDQTWAADVLIAGAAGIDSSRGDGWSECDDALSTATKPEGIPTLRSG
jgi:hypothetical protein